jgi:glutaredoxin
MKKLLVVFFLFVTSTSAAFAALADVPTPEPTAYVFGNNDCVYCKDEVRWLFNEGIHFQYLNISSSTQAKGWYDALLQKHQLSPIFPLTIIGPEVIVGFEKSQTTGHEITLAVVKAKKSDILTIDDHLARAPALVLKPAVHCEGLACDTTNLQTIVPVPFLGLVNLFTVSKTTVALCLGVVTLTRLLSVGWLLITFGLLILLPQRKYFIIAATLLALAEIGLYGYFFNGGYTSLTRFVIEGSFAKVLGGGGVFARQWYVLLYSTVALIDNLLVTALALKAQPYVSKLDDAHPGSIGIIATALFFGGGGAIAYFIQFP